MIIVLLTFQVWNVKLTPEFTALKANLSLLFFLAKMYSTFLQFALFASPSDTVVLLVAQKQTCSYSPLVLCDFSILRRAKGKIIQQQVQQAHSLTLNCNY